MGAPLTGPGARLATAALTMRGSVLRGLTRSLSDFGLLEKVKLRVSAGTRATIEDPPLSITWLSLGVLEEIAVVAADIVGPRQWGEITYVGARDGILPILRAPCEAFLRIFGVSPRSLLTRINSIVGLTLRGLRYTWTDSSDHDGHLEIAYDGCRDVPAPLFYGSAASIRLIFDLTGHEGSIEGPDISRDGARNRAVCRIRWQ